MAAGDPRRLWRWTAIALACWIVEGLTYALQFHLLQGSAGRPVTWAYALNISLSNAVVWVPFTVLALWLVERFPVGRGRWLMPQVEVQDDGVGIDRAPAHGRGAGMGSLRRVPA